MIRIIYTKNVTTKMVLDKKPFCKALKLKDRLNKPFVNPVGPNCSIRPLSIAKKETL